MRFLRGLQGSLVLNLTQLKCKPDTRSELWSTVQRPSRYQVYTPHRRPVHSTLQGSCHETCSEGDHAKSWSDAATWNYEFVSGDICTLSAENSIKADGSSSSSVSETGMDDSAQRGSNSPADKVEDKKCTDGDGHPATENYDASASTGAAAWLRRVKKKTPKSKLSWMCEDCGESFPQWWGSCRHCGHTNTLKQFLETEKADNKSRGSDVSDKIMQSWLPRRPGYSRPQRLTDINKGINQMEWRIPLAGHFGAEVSRVLGGGLVPGSLVVVGGDPGVGKSTLLMQLAAVLAEGNTSDGRAPVLYASGEESAEQIGSRATRMGISTHDLFLYSSTDIEDIMEKLVMLSPRALVMDSIQTVYLKGAVGSAGSIAQVKECTLAFLRLAKESKIPVLLIGHVTKTGDIAGPRILEHIVDAVLYLEGEFNSSLRILRSVKNRFGSTDEIGIFEMSDTGLQVVSNPSEIFLSERYSDSDSLIGLAIAVVLDGSRTFLIEIQALCSDNLTVGRHFNGMSSSRGDMIIAVLIKQVGLKLQDKSILLNIVSGFKLTETAGDLAVAVAICSSFLELSVPNDIAFIGEVGLAGELRPVPRIDKRVSSVAKLGYRRCFIPKAAEKSIGSLNVGELVVTGFRNLKDVISTLCLSQQSAA